MIPSHHHRPKGAPLNVATGSLRGLGGTSVFTSYNPSVIREIHGAVSERSNSAFSLGTDRDRESGYIEPVPSVSSVGQSIADKAAQSVLGTVIAGQKTIAQKVAEINAALRLKIQSQLAAGATVNVANPSDTNVPTIARPTPIQTPPATPTATINNTGTKTMSLDLGSLIGGLGSAYINARYSTPPPPTILPSAPIAATPAFSAYDTATDFWDHW